MMPWDHKIDRMSQTLFSLSSGPTPFVIELKKDQWDGPFTILNIECYEIVLTLRRGQLKFQFTVVETYVGLNSFNLVIMTAETSATIMEVQTR